MNEKPKFVRLPDGTLLLGYSIEAGRVSRFNQTSKPMLCKTPDKVRKDAMDEVRRHGGDTSNEMLVLGYHKLQFGSYRGQTFKWMMENGLGYCGWMVDGMRGERPVETPLSKNKFLFKKYIELFEEGREVVAIKRRERMVKAGMTAPPKTPVPTSTTAVSKVSPTRTSTVSKTQPTRTSTPLSSLLVGKNLSPRKLATKMKKCMETRRDKNKWIDLAEKNFGKISLFLENYKPSKSLPSTGDNIGSVVPDPSCFLSDEERDELAQYLCLKHPTLRTYSTDASCMVHDTICFVVSRLKSVDSPIAESMDDEELVAAVEEVESSQLHGKEKTPASASSSSGIEVTSFVSTSAVLTEKPASTVVPSSAPERILLPPRDSPLPEGWKQSLPEADQHWVSRALFKWSKHGKPELDWAKVDKIWWYPPQPPLICTQMPSLDRYFASPLLLWMPRKLCRIRLVCPQATCHNKELTSAGIYPHTRQVIDIDGIYNLAAEYLECRTCKKKCISWSNSITKQLDVGHHHLFPVRLTYRYACDLRVIRLLRQRGLGNSATQIRHKLNEQHCETWLKKTAYYLTDCQGFVTSGLVSVPTPQEPPAMPNLPGFRWLQTVYCNDVLLRLDEIKASITSIFGNVLKMDSTKKVVKKLAGHAAGTASWATNVGNEHGQILMSVLTASEGSGLGPMVKGIIQRYSSAKVSPPEILYVDRDCCGGHSSLRTLFSDWPNLQIRLDIWHFMRRFSAGCTTDAHQLYGIFMGRLSSCIFEWSSEDLDLLKAAKRADMISNKMTDPSDADVIKQITKKELPLHCRRKTRGVEQTTQLISDLLEAFVGDQGLDVMGVPLLDKSRIWNIWESQKKHIECIQDPDTALYVKTGQLSKGGVQLPVYRCARGSTSLESFHLHLNRFIPGTSASDVHFQAYLLDGLVRWNEDRATAAVGEDIDKPRSYSGLLRHAVNKLGQTVLGREINSSYKEPRKYTGELIGIEYLYSQTGRVLQELAEDQEFMTASEDDEEEDEGFQENEFEDITISLPKIASPTSSPTQQMSSETLVMSSETQQTSQTPQVPSPNRSRLHFLHVPGQETGDIEEPAQEFLETLSRENKTMQVVESSIPSTIARPVEHMATAGVQRPLEQIEESTTATPHGMLGSSPEESVGPDNVPGYDRVEALADYLFNLRKASGSLTNEQANKIVTLWNQLHPSDRSPSKFSPRHKSRLTQGRFKSSKSTVHEGVDSTKRCFLGQNAGPAQWPDCNRYVECLISKLCSAYPSPKRSKARTIVRWTLILQSYKNIRHKILNNAIVMRETGMQLVEINQTTLTQWYNKTAKRQERQILQQGITHPTPPMVAEEPLPAAKETPSSFPAAHFPEAFVFTLPANVAGQASTRTPTAQIQSTQGSLETQDAPLPRSTKWYRKHKLQKEAVGEYTRKYVKRTDAVTYTCGKCGNIRDKENHRQYFGNWYCGLTSDLTYEEWRAGFANKKYKKKKD